MKNCALCDQPIKVVSFRLGAIAGKDKAQHEICAECWAEITRKRKR